MSSPLNTPTSVAAATHTFTVSAASNRALVVLLQTEGTQTGTMTMTYGGQSMVNVVQVIAGSGTTQQTVAIFFLNDAGIVAASTTTLAAGNYGTTDLTIHAASYQDCVQTTPTNYDTDTSDAGTPNPLAALDITTASANSIVVAGSGMGNAGSAAWAAPLTERTDQAAGSSNGSLADDEVASGSTLVACECTWTTQNRACAVAMEIVHQASEGITSIDPTTFDMDNADIDINGSNFLATPSGDVYLSDADTLAGSVNEVDITSAINTWADALINLDLTQLSAGELSSLHTLGPGQRYIIVVNDDSDEYGSDAITLHRPEAFVMSLGAGTPGATTARLEAPSTKTTGDFDAGRFEEASNPATTVDITADDYTEMVFSMEAKPLSREVAYNFRVTANGVALDTYTETPQITISGAEDINASDMSSASTVSAPSIDGVRLIDASDISSSTTVTAPTVTPLVIVEDVSLWHDAIAINAQDMSSSTTVTNASFEPIRHIGASNLSSSTTVTNASVEAIGFVDINAQDLSSSTSVTEPSLDRVRTISATDLSSSSTVTNPGLDGVRDISAADLSSSSTVTAPTVVPLVIIEDVSLWHDAIAVDAVDLSSSTTVTSPSLDGVWAIDATDLSSATTVTEPSFDVTRAINAVDLSSSTTVTAPTVQIAGAVEDINAQDLSSSTTVTSPALDVVRLIDATDLSSATTVTAPVLSHLRDIDAQNLSSATTVTSPALDGVRAIDASDLSSSTTVTNAGVQVAGADVPINAQDLSSLTTVENAQVVPLVIVEDVSLWHDALAINASGLLSSTTVTNASVQVVGVIDINAQDLSSSTTVTNPALDVIRLVDAVDISSSTTVTSPALDRIRTIDASDLSSATTVTAPTVEIYYETHDINAQDVSSATTVDQAELDAIRLIGASDVSSATTVDQAELDAIRLIAPDSMTSQPTVGPGVVNLFIVGGLIDFAAAKRAFNFNAQTKNFNFDAEPKNFNIKARIRA